MKSIRKLHGAPAAARSTRLCDVALEVQVVLDEAIRRVQVDIGGLPLECRDIAAP